MGTLRRDRFLWVEDLRKALVFLLDDSIHPRFEVREGNNPLEARLVIALYRQLPKASRLPIRAYIRWWAKTGDCEIPRIHIDNRHIVAEVLFKHRHPRGKPKDESTQADSGTG